MRGRIYPAKGRATRTDAYTPLSQTPNAACPLLVTRPNPAQTRVQEELWVGSPKVKACLEDKPGLVGQGSQSTGAFTSSHLRFLARKLAKKTMDLDQSTADYIWQIAHRLPSLEWLGSDNSAGQISFSFFAFRNPRWCSG